MNISNIISLLGSLIGTLGGIVVSMKLTNFRLDKLEKQVEKIIENDKDIAVLKIQTKKCIADVDYLNKKLDKIVGENNV